MYLTYKELIIRPANEGDINILCDWWSDGSIMAHAGYPKGLKTDKEKLKKILDNDNENSKLLIIEINEKRVGEMNYNIKNGFAQIGIKICDFSYHGNGHGTNALRLLINYLFDTFNIERVCLDTNLLNVRAQYIYEKIGFVREKVNVDSWRNQEGELQSSIDYELKRETYTNRLLK